MPNNDPGLPNQASYDIGTDVFTDNVTTLMWEANPSLDHHTFEQAGSYCGALMLAGFDDWRLPNVTEFVSLFDRTRDFPALPPDIPVQFDTDDTNNTYAFAQSSLDSNGLPWAVSLASGRVSQGGPNSFRAWCVRGRTDSPPGTYQNNGDGTSLDERTGLLWQTAQSPTEVSQMQAQASCGSLTLGGFDDWRLPSAKELFTLFQPGLVSPRIDLAAFPGSTRGPFVTSTDGTYLDFALGPESRTGDATFRCVR
jgi:hypothetical protein